MISTRFHRDDRRTAHGATSSKLLTSLKSLTENCCLTFEIIVSAPEV